jgi:hypothetical protein
MQNGNPKLHNKSSGVYNIGNTYFECGLIRTESLLFQAMYRNEQSEACCKNLASTTHSP